MTADRDPPGAATQRGRGATTFARAIVRPMRLIATALAIIFALAFGIPWLINLVWRS